MKKGFLLLLFFAGLVMPTHAQNLEWAYGWGNALMSPGNVGIDVVSNDNGDVLVSGYFLGTIDFDPGAGVASHTAAGGSDGFIAKFDAAGNFQWVYVIGSTDNDKIVNVTLDNADNVYFFGTLGETADADPGAGVVTIPYPNPGALSNGVIGKLTAAGSLAWAAPITETLNINANAIAVSPNGTIGIAGSVYGKVDFDPDPVDTAYFSPAPGGSNFRGFLSLYDNSGNYLNAYCFGPDHTEVSDLVFDDNNNAWVCGDISGDADLDPGAGTINVNSMTDGAAFLAGYSTSLALQDYALLARGSSQYSVGLRRTPAGDYYWMTRLTGDSLDLDPGPGTYWRNEPYNVSVCLVKLDANLDFVWGGAVTSPYYMEGHYLDVDASGYAYMTGDFLLTMDGDPTTGVNTIDTLVSGPDDTWFVRVDPNGNFYSADVIGGDDVEEAWAVSASGPGCFYMTGVYTSGAFQVSMWGTPASIPSNGASNFFLAKYCPCNATVTNDTICGEETISFYGQNPTESGYYLQMYEDANGCDSVVALALKANRISPQVSLTAGTLTAEQANADAYQWVDCDQEYAEIAGATAQTFTPVVNGNYACKITLATCTDTTFCTTAGPTATTNPRGVMPLQIYPNPATESFYLRAEGLTNGASWQLMNVAGQQVASGTVDPARAGISVSELPAGLYLVKVSAGARVWTGRVVVE